MEIAFTILNFLLIGFIIVLPILLLTYFKKKEVKRYFFLYTLSSIIILGFLTIIMTWWFYKSDLILLSHLGYNIDGMSETTFYGNVAQENMETVKRLETSIMGIGWPLKAIFGFICVFPYPFIIYFGDKLNTRMKKKQKTWPNSI